MKVCLYWNARAGEGVSVDEISAVIRRAGHEIVRVIAPDGDLGTVHAEGVECLVAAGGDGTIARAGRALAGSMMPLAVLPLGTANNIAASLGIEGDPARLVQSWGSRSIAAIDVGTIDDVQGRGFFVEGVGVGLVPEGIKHGRSIASKDAVPEADSRLAMARLAFRDVLADLEPQPYRLVIDGSEVNGESLLVEVLNISSVGPRIRLSPEAHPADAMLSIVIAGEADREALAEHLNGRWDDRLDHAAMRSWRATAVTAHGWHEYHVDDEIRDGRGQPVTLGVARGALRVLA